MTGEERKLFHEMNTNLAVIATKIESYEVVMKSHSDIIHALDRTVNNGLCEKLKSLSEEFHKHLQTLREQPKDGRRRTDLNNRSKPVKWGIVIGLVGLVLGNLAMIGYVFSKIGEWLLAVP